MRTPSFLHAKPVLALFAVGGVAVFHLVLIAPFAFALLLNPWVWIYGAYSVWHAVGVLVLIWWTLQPNHHTPGHPLSRSEAPALFGAIDALADRLGAARIHGIQLTDEFNAGALEVPMRWQPWRKRRVLLLGVPLLAMVDVDTVRAVVAHELGHFSHRHGRLGHWIYRARAGWIEYAETPAGSVTVLERGAAAFARWFAPRFSRWTFRYSRLCEFEADACGADTVGAQRMASALLTIEVLGTRWQQMSHGHLSKLVATQEAPPAAWLDELQRQVLALPPQVDEWEQLRDKASQEQDTHPSLGERVGALGVSGEQLMRETALAPRAAGAEWLSGWDDVVARYNAQWLHAHAANWRREHIRQRHQRRQLDAWRAAPDFGIGRLRLESEYGEPGTVIELASRLLDDAATAAEALYLLGAAQLAGGDRKGIASLERCIAQDAAWTLAARTLIERHAGLLDTDAARRRNATLLKRARQRRGRLLGECHLAIPRAQLEPAPLDVLSASVLREVFAGMATVAAAWCACDEAIDPKQRRYPAVALILRLHTERVNASGQTEDDIAAAAAALLSGLFPEGTLKLVWTAYTTEPLTPELDALLAGWAQARHRACLVAPRPGEAVGPGVRATALG